MNNTFELKKGKIVFEKDKIKISDNERVKRFLRLFLPTSIIILVLTSAIAYFTTGDLYETWLGFFVGVAVFLAFAVSPFTSVQGEIDLKEVKSLKMKRGLFDEYLEIKLTNNKIRRVTSIVDKEGLREYIETDSQSKPIFEGNAFELKKGKIVFEEDKIVITDNAGRQKAQMLFMSGCWVFYGTLSVIRYLKTGDQFQLWTGLFIGIAHFVVFVGFLFRSVQPEISMNEVKSMKLKSRFGNEFLNIKLNNGRVRNVAQIEDTDELRVYLDKKSAR